MAGGLVVSTGTPDRPRGGRLPDPGLGAVCGRCGEPREAHGGPKLLGACPDQSGLRARRFSIPAEDRPTNQDQGPELIVRQARAVIPVSVEMLAEAQETRRAMDAWMAMSPEERAAATAKRDAEQMAAKAAAEKEARRFLGWLREAIGDGQFAGAHLEILSEHVPVDGGSYGRFSGKVCGTCSCVDRDDEGVEGDPYPCVTLRALAKAYGWEEAS